IVFPSILCDIILSQHPNIRQEGEIAKKRESALNLHYKLFSEQHVSDIAEPSTKATSAPMTRNEIIAALEAHCKELDEKKLQFEKMIEALKHEDVAEETDPIVGNVDAGNDVAGNNVDDDAEDEEEDSGTSGSASV
ncbi:envelope-like protein, partial [Trifolium medium]|nr:envelope-like protein [Trifolium medium]